MVNKNFHAKSQVCASKNGWVVAIINNMNIDIQNCKFVAQKMAQLLQFKICKNAAFFQYPPILFQCVSFYRHGCQEIV